MTLCYELYHILIEDKSLRMNLQTQMAGQFSGQVPNQPLPALPHQQNMMQNSVGGQRSTLIMEPGFVKARRFIQEKM